MSNAVRHESTIRDYARVLIRNWWIVLAPIVLVPVLAYLIAAHQPARYQATASVYLKEADIGALVSGLQNVTPEDPARVAATQIILAQTPFVADRVLRAAGVTSEDPNTLLASTQITADPSADILYFTVEDHDPVRATRLANAYAAEYTVVRRSLDTGSLRQAVSDLLKRSAALRAQGRGAYAASLTAKAQQLQTLAVLESSNAVLARPAATAAQVAPRPRRYALVGLALGVILGVGLAFLRDGLDTRVRSVEEVSERLRLPLLARVPEPPRRLEQANELVTLVSPQSENAEAFRLLRTNLDFANVDRSVNSIMITSALEREGKSTTIANLAVVEALSGRRVVLVDLDLRRPRLAEFFRLEGKPGLTNVLLGYSTLEEATAPIPLTGPDDDRNAGNGNGPAAANGNGPRGVSEPAALAGTLDVLPTGPIPPNPGEFVATEALAALLARLSASYELVLIDAPPILPVGDALTLSSSVSGVMVLTRIPVARRAMLSELARVLEAWPTRKLGFIAAGARLGGGYGAGYGYGYYSKRTSQPVDKPVREGVA